MATYRLTKLVVGFVSGTKQVVTIPAGALIDRDHFLAAVGITSVVWQGKRIAVMILDLDDRPDLSDDSGQPGEKTPNAA
jgi:hypothetical protein